MNVERVRAPSGQSTSTSSSETPNQRHPKYRTKLCRNFPLGTCRYGEHCSYLHVSTSPSLQPQYQTLPSLPMLAQTIFRPCGNTTFVDSMYHDSSLYSQPMTLRRTDELEQTQAPRRRGGRTDGSSRRPSRPAQASHVEEWRLSINARMDGEGLFPPAPPTTPIIVPLASEPSSSRAARDDTPEEESVLQKYATVS
ncbi:hypothetical protein NUW54_g12255 [Trametes sanguinea]|uniref:Uncharacterized protein n=1 Tax=Trametes sanguinea TaxID=158606 RepID=A0ACC1N147_9APHY|nr:hypothetical protein NUW54_g12255 [Trametes sanguinea]